MIHCDANRADRGLIRALQRLVVAHTRAHDHLLEDAELLHLGEQRNKARAGPGHDKDISLGIQDFLQIGRKVFGVLRDVDGADFVSAVVDRELAFSCSEPHAGDSGLAAAGGVRLRGRHQFDPFGPLYVMVSGRGF